jgi:predicted O-methyltransferase YrrM
MRETRILVPLAKEDKRREMYKRRVKNAREKLETKSYDTFDAYLADIGAHSYDDYLQLIRSTLRRPTVFFKQDMSQIYINTFNP